MEAPRQRADVVIIGVGFCGRVAASELSRRRHDVVVVEARERIGGRAEVGVIGSDHRLDALLGPSMEHLAGQSEAILPRPYEPLSGTEALATADGRSIGDELAGLELSAEEGAVTDGIWATTSSDTHPGDRPPSPIQAVAGAIRPWLPEAKVLDATEHDWRGDEFSLGTWAMLKPGQLSTCGPDLYRQQSPIFFGGSDIASGWAGFIDGAIETGIAASVEIDAGVAG